MKKMYSAPVAEFIEAEMDDLLAVASKAIVVDDPDVPGPGYGEGKGGMNGDFDGGIFDE